MADVGRAMPQRVEVLQSERVLDAFFAVDQVTLRYERFDGSMSRPVTRLLFERGDAVAVLPYERDTWRVLLVRQFRYPALVRGGPGWLWEVIAGMQDGAADAVVRREALEEAGLALRDLQAVTDAYLSPGACSERVRIYLAECEGTLPDGGYAGLREEGEDILIRTFALDEALAMARSGAIADAKTVIALQQLAMRRAGL